jgi:hypothetical protein
MTAPGFEEAGVTVAGAFLITRQTGGGNLSGSFTLTLAVDGAASESQSGLIVGTVQADGAVVLTLRIEGATDTRLEGTPPRMAMSRGSGASTTARPSKPRERPP